MEQRLIDANALIEATKKFCDGYEVHWTDNKVLAWIDHAPTIDAVEVVRCKDFKHGEFERENRMWACVRCADYDEDFDMFTGFIEYHNEGHFCSYGERRDGDG